EQPLHARRRRRALGRRDDARHDRGQSRVREGRVPEARLPRRYDLFGDRGRRQARVALAAAVGHRDLRAPGAQSARRGRHGGASQRDDAQEGRLTVARRRRSLHFVPGGNERMLARALTLAADGLILDLEDAVAPDRKAATRGVVREWLGRDFGGRERWVRMNPIATGLGQADLEETIASRPDGYVVPKPGSAADIRAIVRILDRLAQRHGIQNGATRLVLIATETPEGLLNIREIAAATPRTVAISWGVEDLGAAMGLGRVRDAEGRYLDIPRYARVMCSVVASASGVEAIDTVFTDIADLDGLRATRRTSPVRVECGRSHSPLPRPSRPSRFVSKPGRRPRLEPARSWSASAHVRSVAPTCTSSRATCRRSGRRSCRAIRSSVGSSARARARGASGPVTVWVSPGFVIPVDSARRAGAGGRIFASTPSSPDITPTVASPTTRSSRRASRTRSLRSSAMPRPRRSSARASSATARSS